MKSYKVGMNTGSNHVMWALFLIGATKVLPPRRGAKIPKIQSETGFYSVRFREQPNFSSIGINAF
jgi:hypothetical protein